MHHLAMISRLSSVAFRACSTFRNRSRKHNRNIKIELERAKRRVLILLPLQAYPERRISDCATPVVYVFNPDMRIYTRASPRRNSGPTLEITFATYCGNSSHYDESWMAFFLLTQEIPGSGQTNLATQREIEISPRTLGTLGMDIATDGEVCIYRDNRKIG